MALNRSIVPATILVVALVGHARGANFVEAVITADNRYGLYHGRSDGSELTLVGGGDGNWATTETWTFTPDPDDHLFVLAWDEGGPQMWIAEFTLPTGHTVLSNTTDWQFSVTGEPNPGPAGPLPPLSTVIVDISRNSWQVPLVSRPHGDGWSDFGSFSDISLSAFMVWHDTFDTSTSDDSYVIFRTVQPLRELPEPATLSLLLLAFHTLIMNRHRS